MEAIRTLQAGDEARLEAFLARHADSSMFLRSNLRAAGIEYHGAPYQAVYVARETDGRIDGVVAHAWNDNLLLQDPAGAGELALQAVRRSARPVAGLIGPWTQTTEARRALGLASIMPQLDSHDDLYSLELARLIVPRPLANGAIRCRAARRGELGLCARWRADYCLEILGYRDTPDFRADCQAMIERLWAEDHLWVAERDGAPRGMTAFNARLADCVQVGGVYTPPEYRGQGIARAAVAGSLLEARDQGARRAILFTDTPAARQCYEAIGFVKTGDYGLVLYAEPVHPPLETASARDR